MDKACSRPWFCINCTPLTQRKRNHSNKLTQFHREATAPADSTLNHPGPQFPHLWSKDNNADHLTHFPEGWRKVIKKKKTFKRHVTKTRATRVATLINGPDRLGEMTGHTLMNFSQVVAHPVHFTDGAGANGPPQRKVLEFCMGLLLSENFPL